MTTEDRLARLEIYVADLRSSVHFMTHQIVLLSRIKDLEDATCPACGRKMTDEPGPIVTYPA